MYRDPGRFYSQQVCVENKIDDVLDTAFGVNETPSWEDFLAFLADRCIPKTRKGLDYYLDAVGVPEYDPVLLVEKTQEEWRRITNGWKLFDAAYQRQGCGDDFARKSGKMV